MCDVTLIVCLFALFFLFICVKCLLLGLKFPCGYSKLNIFCDVLGKKFLSYFCFVIKVCFVAKQCKGKGWYGLHCANR